MLLKCIAVFKFSLMTVGMCGHQVACWSSDQIGWRFKSSPMHVRDVLFVSTFLPCAAQPEIFNMKLT